MNLRVNISLIAGTVKIQFPDISIQEDEKLKDIIVGFSNSEILHYEVSDEPDRGLFTYTVWWYTQDQARRLKKLLEGGGFTIL